MFNIWAARAIRRQPLSPGQQYITRLYANEFNFWPTEKALWTAGLDCESLVGVFGHGGWRKLPS